MRVAVLDDYQNISQTVADWGPLSDRATIDVFTTPIGDEDAVALALSNYETIVCMRERTQFPASLIAQLDRLKLIITTGMRNRSIDGDAARQPKEHEAINAQFRSPGSKIMVGTQMLAKGLDFPDVSLVGVVLADLGLTAPNFRAAERSFQLLAQVAGRAGRRDEPGEVVIQTYLPDHYVVKALEKLQYVEFAMKELAYREQLRQPPFERHLRLICQHFDYGKSLNLANKFVQDLMAIRASGGFAVDVLGPMLAYPHRLRGKYRWQVVLRGTSPMEVLLRASVPTDCVVDVDPVEVN